jgi:hypothetical protein
MADAGDVRVTLKLMREQFDAGMKAVNQSLDKMGPQTQKSTSQMNKSLASVGRELVGLAAGFVGVHRGIALMVDAFKGFAEQETLINRVGAAARAAGASFEGWHDKVDQLGTQFIRFGLREQAASSAVMRLVSATGDMRTSMDLAGDAMRFAASKGVDAETVAVAMAKAYGGQERQLKALLLEYGLAAKDIEDFDQALDLIRQGGEDVTEVLSDQQQAIYDLDAAWDTFKDSLGEKLVVPGIAVLEYLNIVLTNTNFAVRSVIAAMSGRPFADFINEMMQLKAIMMMPEAEMVGPSRDELMGRRRRRPRKFGAGDGAGATVKAGPDWREGREKLWGQELKDDLSDIDDWMEQIAHDGKVLAEWTDRQNELLKVQRDTYAEIERSAAALAGDIIGGLIDGTASWASILSRVGELIIRIVQDMATMRSLMSALGLSPGGATPGGGTEAPPPAGGFNTASIGGMSPLPVGGFGPAPVYVVVQGDVTRFAEFSERVVTAGAGRMARLGR